MLECSCGLQYVGRTAQTLRARINKHRSNVGRGFLKRSISRNALTHHDCDFTEFKVTPIEQISIKTQNRLERLSKREMFWIFKMNTISRYGLNEAEESIFILCSSYVC